MSFVGRTGLVWQTGDKNRLGDVQRAMFRNNNEFVIDLHIEWGRAHDRFTANLRRGDDDSTHFRGRWTFPGARTDQGGPVQLRLYTADDLHLGFGTLTTENKVDLIWWVELEPAD